MNKLITSFLSFVCVSSLSAQKAQFTPNQGALLDGKTIIKVNLTSPLARTYSLAAERILMRRLSLQVGLAQMPTGTVPFSAKIDDLLNREDFKVKDLKLSSFMVTPELRCYLGKGYGRGFYLMAYYRYQTAKLSDYQFSYAVIQDLRAPSAGALGGGINPLSASSIEFSQRSVQTEMSASLSTHSFGFGLGAQWLLGRRKNIVIDWNILGAHYGKGAIDFTGEIKDLELSPLEVKSLQEKISDHLSELPSVDLGAGDIQVDKKSISVRNISVPWAFFRASLSLGFRF